MIKLVLSTDVAGFAHNATVLASILRRTKSPVWVRVYTRGFSYRSFEVGGLRADFIRCDEDVSGTYPSHVSEAVFDRLRIIRDFDDWDRVLVLDHDMLVFCDLAEYFGEAFEGNLLMGRLFGPGNTLGLQMKPRGGLPERWDDCVDYPYFYMGPMMNLEAMRAEGFWDLLLEAHASISQDEQISLTAASGGRIKGVGKKWNLVPMWDKLEEAAQISLDSGGASQLIADVPWRSGIPEGLIHWSGPAKPWHYRSKVWRANLWESEACGWEQLRVGNWTKPVAFEIEPHDTGRVRSLVQRGWNVHVISGMYRSGAKAAALDRSDLQWPNLSHHSPESSPPGDGLVDLIRFGPDSSPLGWLQSLAKLPDRVVLEGPRRAEDVAALREAGYRGESRIIRREWPGGGPHPKVLTYGDPNEALAVAGQEDLYLSRLAAEQSPTPAPVRSSQQEDRSWEITNEMEDYIRQQLASVAPAPSAVLELGPGRSTRVLAETFPEAAITSIEHSPEHFRCLKHQLSDLENVRLHHAPLDPSLPWYDFSRVPLGTVDLLLVDGPPGKSGSRSRSAAISLIDLIRPGGVVLLDDTDRMDEKADRAQWQYEGFEIVEDFDRFSVLRRPEALPRRELAAVSKCSGKLASFAARTYVISLPNRKDRLADLNRNWQTSSIGLKFEVVDGIRPDPAEIRWHEMKGMEGYGKPEFLRGDYVIGAVGCKRAGIRALETFLESGEETALICQDDCRWTQEAPQVVEKALAELPSSWDLVYFSASARSKHQPFSPNLIRLTGARLCTAILWKRETALAVLPQLTSCDCEMDLLMQRLHGELQTYCVVPMPAYQAHSFSNIIGEVIKVPNR